MHMAVHLYAPRIRKKDLDVQPATSRTVRLVIRSSQKDADILQMLARTANTVHANAKVSYVLLGASRALCPVVY